ncbi:MAG: hypothetical protein J3Q66DRAFT_372628 [Benniella sp.]|nr:MAG: hypothetical protein J3Q66DRAFT_372628 [Benniella sp.]
MFGIQELDDMVCGLLTRHDLVQCARVNKKWHAVVIPYIWKDLSCLNTSSSTQRHAFTLLLLEDYLQEQGKAESPDSEHVAEQPLQAQPPFLSALAKYGCWIRILPDPRGLVQLSYGLMQDYQSTEQQLLIHFFKRHQAAQLPYYSLKYDTLGSSPLKETVAQLVLPRVHHLSVQASYSGKRGELWKLKRLLSRCSTTLEKLTLKIDYRYDDRLNIYVGYDPDFQAEEEEPDTTSSTEWSSLKELVLCPRECVGTLQPTTFWSWFCKRCGQVERIDISNFRRGADESITENMLKHMPNLNGITIGDGTEDGSTITPDRVRSLLSGSRNGWKVMDLKMPVSFSDGVGDTIQKYFPTLEVLRITCYGIPGEILVEVLSSSPYLHTFHGIPERTNIKSDIFNDQDLATGVLKKWSCETSLKVLKVAIRDIPRPGLEGSTTVEAHPGQGREIQGLVYDRLARLTNLETLSLGDTPEEDTYCFWARRGVRTQFDCLEMSLESGLHKLSELTKLKELNVLGMKTKIGIKEIQWMTEHWPRLRVLRGLDGSDDGGKQAVQWIQEHHPEIDLMRTHLATPKLNEITIGGGTHEYSTIHPVENLFSRSRNGWKVIVLTKPARFLSSSMNAIRKHFHTLQELRMVRADFQDSQFVEMLSSCPNLHTFYEIGVRGIRLPCNTFIDQNSHTGELKAWLCERSLKVLKVDIGLVPRPELKGVGVIREAHPGQGREIQGLVYDRLARLRNLEILSMGDTSEEDINKHLQRRTVEDQIDCLELSLKSGLHKLSELTKLKELNVSNMKTRIGVKEVQWMTIHWPKLRVLSGLDESDDEIK